MKLGFYDIKALADEGHSNAQYKLGIMYEKGQGVDQDMTKAVEWYTKAAKNGHIDAQENLLCKY